MKFRLIELEGISGEKAKIYSVRILDNGVDDTLYDLFLSENFDSYSEEIEDIEDALTTMGNDVGLEGNRIIPFEGENYDDGIIAICNRPNKILRLYGIMYGETVAIIGGGGVKPGDGELKKWPKLHEEQSKIVRIRKIIEAAKLADDILIIDEGIFPANFIFDSENYE